MLTVKESADSIRNDNKIIGLLCNLRGRWQDEKECEDFNEYLAVIKREVPNVTGGRKSDFSFTVACVNGALRVKVGMRAISFVVLEEFGC